MVAFYIGGGGEIRTLEASRLGGFQDRWNKPLSDPSTGVSPIITDDNASVEGLTSDYCHPNMLCTSFAQCLGGIFHCGPCCHNIVY